MHAIWLFLKANWPYEAVGLYFLSEVLAKVPWLRANTPIELIVNATKPILRRIPLVAQLAELLDTPQPRPVAEPLPLPPPPKAGEQ